MTSLLGKMPPTSIRRLISPFRRSIGLVECSLVRCRERHLNEHVDLGLLDEGGELSQLKAELSVRPPISGRLTISE
jgi:hypothetical protein